MLLWDLLRAADASLLPERTKIHLAVNNGADDPVNVYRDGRFHDWQAWQMRRNFELPHVVSLIQLEARNNQWLFAGSFDSMGCSPDGDGFRYRLAQREHSLSLDGRLIVEFERTGRQSYLLADHWLDRMLVRELRAEKLSVPDFPGFKGLRITKGLLDLIVREKAASWMAALSSVAGVYLIADRETGKFYVGSATGEGGLWQRWCDYSRNCHGDNRDLKALLGKRPHERAASLQYSVLEIADTHASADEVRSRESHWKEVLLTRIHGLNPN